MRFIKCLSFLSIVPFLASCGGEMTREQALDKIANYDSDKAIEVLGASCLVTIENTLVKSTGCFAEGGSDYDAVKKYVTETKTKESSTLSYFITSSKIASYNTSSYKYLSVTYKNSGSNGFTIDVKQSDERDNTGLVTKMRETIHDVINDYGVLVEETLNIYFAYEGSKQGEFEFKTVTTITFPLNTQQEE